MWLFEKVSSAEFLLEFFIAITITVLLAFIISRAFPILFEDEKRISDEKKQLKHSISEKLKAGIKLSVQDILDIGRGCNVSGSSSIDVIYQLFAESSDKDEIEIIKPLISDLNKKAPFEDLPEEVKPSMIRLSEICSESTLDSDKNALIPIQQALSKYKTMLSDHHKVKNRSRVSYIITIVAFFIGIMGIIIAFRTPSEEFIKTTINDCVRTHFQEYG